MEFVYGSRLGPQPIKFPDMKMKAVKINPSLSYEYGFDSVDDQQQWGTCTCNAGAGLMEFFLHKHYGITEEVSRLAPYWALKFDNPSREDMTDSGGYVSDALNVYKTRGVVLESQWTYTPNNFLQPVPDNLWDKSHLLKNFVSVPNTVEGMKHAMNLAGPLIIGTGWASEWESQVGSDGFLNPNPTNLAGGHCVLLVGYSDRKQAFRGRNSWGTGWGNNGMFWLSYSVAQNAQFWPSDVYTVQV